MTKFAFLRIFIIVVFVLICSNNFHLLASDNSKTPALFNEIIERAQDECWNHRLIEDIIPDIAKMMLGIPYLAHTLESPGEEKCRITFEGMDCVTFYENVVGIARIIKKHEAKYDDLVNEITLMRYRSGKIDGYLSRLHYTSDWIIDNVEKGIVMDILAEHYQVMKDDLAVVQKVSFMSSNPNYYEKLKNSPNLIPELKAIEDTINSHTIYYLPTNKIKKYEEYIQSGDIITIATAIKGLDFSHTGFAYRDKDNKLRLLHASSAQKEIILDTEITEYLSKNKNALGISVIRPLAP
jgi:hypothetical protein